MTPIFISPPAEWLESFNHNGLGASRPSPGITANERASFVPKEWRGQERRSSLRLPAAEGVLEPALQDDLGVGSDLPGELFPVLEQDERGDAFDVPGLHDRGGLVDVE